MVFNLHKKRGETPLECIRRFKRDHPQYSHEKMTYAGRLDPLAEGVLLVLSGDDVHKKEGFLGLSKEYDAEVLIGVETDTYDILGKVLTVSENVSLREKDMELIEKRLVGELSLEYPLYSSRTLKGKPLWVYAREKEKVIPPIRSMKVYDLFIKKISHISSKELIYNIEELANLVQGDFRQEEIQQLWKESVENVEQQFPVLHIHIRCASGTYVRSLAHEIGKITGHGACLQRLIRTKVGEYTCN